MYIIYKRELVVNIASKHFRKDLNGLRALAVISVLLFHFEIAPFTGGFVGVDVFFVLSGFLMTQIILGGLKSGSFKFSEFYLRRLARILPALLAVTGFSLLAGYFILLPADYSRLAHEAIQAATFIVNFHFASASGYFAVDPTHSWLLHCWSLAVEFQFYIIYPAILLAGWRLDKERGVVIILISVALISLVFSYFETGRSQMSAFFLLPARAWEFVAGGAVLFFPTPARAYRTVIAACGVFLIAATTIVFGNQLNYPSLWPVLPVLGVVLVIWSTPQMSLLNNSILQFVGKISYSLYLWHWPVIVVAGYATYNKGFLEIAVLLLITLALAWLSFLLIETPFRSAFRSGCLNKTFQIAVGAGLVAGIAIFITNAEGVPSRIPDSILQVVGEAVHREEYRDGNCFLRPEQKYSDFGTECFGDARGAEKPTLAIWGDSLVAHIYPGIAAQAWSGDFNIVQLTASGCPAVIPNFKENASRPNCPEIQRKAYEAIQVIRPDVLILSADCCGASSASHKVSNKLSAEVLAELILSLRADGIKKIFVLGPVPKWRMALPQIVFATNLFNSGDLIDRARHANFSLPEEDRVLRREVESAGADYLSIYDSLCNNGTCLTLVPWIFDKAPIQFDILHFTTQGSAWVASQVVGPALGYQSVFVRETVPLGQPIAFGTSSLGKKYLIRGWMPQEGWGAWTASKNNPGVIKLPVATDHLPSSVQLEFWAQLGPTLEKQEFFIRLPGSEDKVFIVTKEQPVVIEEIKFNESEKLKIAETGLVQLEFRAPQGKSPKEMGLNNDERVLGFGIRNITLLP